jgi:hypothetical protein
MKEGGGPTRRDPTLQMSILYEQILFDPVGKPVFVGPFNQVQLAQPPPVNMLLLISNQWTNGMGLHQQQTVNTDPDGQTLVESDAVEFFLKDSAAAHRVDHRMAVTFSKDGRYRVRVARDGATAIEYFFFVRFRVPVSDATVAGTPPEPTQ